MLKKITTNDVTKIRKQMKREDNIYLSLIDELEVVLKTQSPGEWKIREKDEFVEKELWEQYLGTYKFKDTVHIFTVMYLPESGLVVKKHGHNEIVHGIHTKKGKELYIFCPPGFTYVDMQFCRKDEMHELYNNYFVPIYVISIKIKGRG